MKQQHLIFQLLNSEKLLSLILIVLEAIICDTNKHINETSPADCKFLCCHVLLLQILLLFSTFFFIYSSHISMLFTHIRISFLFLFQRLSLMVDFIRDSFEVCGCKFLLKLLKTLYEMMKCT